MISLLILILQLNLRELSNAFTIFNKTVQYINEGKIKVPEGMNYFIFDEFNFTALDINGDKMNNLYLKQWEIFDNKSVSNYIFVVGSLDESYETIEKTTHNLAEYLRVNYHINKDLAIILLVGISPGRIRIRTGDSLKTSVTDYECKQLISRIQPYLKNEKYYEAWDIFVSDVYKYLNNKVYYYRDYSYSSSGKDIGEIIGIIVTCIVALSIIVVSCVCGYKRFKSNFKIAQISLFFNANKYNNEVFKDNCVICLTPFNNTQIQITTQTDFNTQQQNKNNINNIITLKCGHQYHNKCYYENKIKDCPICTKLNNPIFQFNKEKIIWSIQQDLFPSLGPYIDKTNIKKSKTDDSSIGGLSYSASSYSGGGGSVGGGSVGGSVGGGSIGGASYGSGGATGNF